MYVHRLTMPSLTKEADRLGFLTVACLLPPLVLCCLTEGRARQHVAAPPLTPLHRLEFAFGEGDKEGPIRVRRVSGAMLPENQIAA